MPLPPDQYSVPEDSEPMDWRVIIICTIPNVNTDPLDWDLDSILEMIGHETQLIKTVTTSRLLPVNEHGKHRTSTEAFAAEDQSGSDVKVQPIDPHMPVSVDVDSAFRETFGVGSDAILQALDAQMSKVEQS